ncbi:hypothetical protein BDN67DRAFT_401156 [Paxillus ammoniavirescens]|nr:hypothetical protein BDN67DRAFT_401156 [Paxillus ammoniavirescens]
MAHYPFPTAQSHSPYQQPQMVYAASNPSAYGTHYNTPIQRHNSFNGHTNPQVYHTPSSHGHSGTQYLVVPPPRSRSRSSHGHGHSHSQSHHHGHGYSASASQPVYAAPIVVLHRSHSRSEHSHSHGAGYYPGHQRTISIGDRVRNFFGIEPSHPHYNTQYGGAGRRRHNSFSGYRDDNRHHRSHSRSGLWGLGSADNQRYVDEHGREVDHRGRVIHRIYPL